MFELGCDNLINSRLLKEYMHGYLMHLKLYNRMRSKFEAVDVQSRKERRLKEKVEQ